MANRFFNTAGPIDKKRHYNIPSLERFNLETILSLIEQQKYFVLHAPRQTGKTSYLLALMEYLNTDNQFKCLYTNLEPAQAARGNVEKGIPAILSIIAGDAADYLEDPFLKDNWQRILMENGPYSALQEALKEWTRVNSKPLVLLLDEIDSLVGDTLISLLRQLRSGYAKRPSLFPQSIILCGVRDVKDYRMHSEKEKTIITGGSAFNIKSKSLRMENFTRGEIKALYSQHTRETGQIFSDDTISLAYELTAGQPWLVNALAYETCFELPEGRAPNKEITPELFLKAKENLILRRETHLDQLADKLSEQRVVSVLEPILSGSREPEKIPADDVDYVVDLGLIVKSPQLRIANHIYREIIPRELIYSTQLTISQKLSWYLNQEGRLNMDALLTAFQQFFRMHFDSWIDGFSYREAGPQLLLQAFLQRIVNGGGRVEREYGLGRQRTDLFLEWPYALGTQRVVLELKLRYGSIEHTITNGVKQIAGYMDKCGTKEGYLLIFDRSSATWDEKIFKKQETFQSHTVGVFGM